MSSSSPATRAAAPAAARPAARRARLLVRRLHLWLGLGLGSLFALLGLTGSALVFYTAIDAALHPAVTVGRDAPAPAPTAAVWDRALATGRARWHDPGGRWSIEITGESGAIPARYYPTPGHHAARMMVWFSPDGTRIVRAEPWGGYAMSWIYQLHMQLLAGDAGTAIVGWSGAAMLLLLASGIAVWWPRGGWRKALGFKRDAVPIRRLRDLHKLAGLAGALPLIVVVATGVLLALPAVTQALLAPAPLPAPASPSTPGRVPGRPITVAHALAVAQATLPGGRLVFVDVANGDAPIRVRLQVPGDPHRRFPGSYVFVDRLSGAVLAVHDVRRAGSGTAMARWIRALHDGSIGGLTTRIATVALGLVPALLFATGLLHWRRRRRGTQRPRRYGSSSEASP